MAEPEGDEDVIDWDLALDEVGDGEWEFVLDMVSELFLAVLQHVKSALQGTVEYRKRGTDMTWDEFLATANKIHLAAHTLKGASRQVYCAALGTASEHVEHVIRRARDIAREPSLAESDADKEAARKEISAGMDLVSSTHMQSLVTEARKFAAVVGKLEPDFIADEAEEEVVERLEGAGAEKFDSELATELAAFGK